MDFLDLTLPTPAENLALDEALLITAESGGSAEVLRLWEWPNPAVVLGSGGRLTEDVEEDACRLDGVAILRRASGGGTVLLAAGCLCFTVVLDYNRAASLQVIRSSYSYVLDRIRAGLGEYESRAVLAGTSDLAMEGRKFSGNAQQRKQRFLLHHGTLLYGFDVSLVRRYLRQPGRQPSYRENREHSAFLMNLPLAGPELKARLRTAWQSDGTLSSTPMDLVRQLVRDKYSQPEWIRRR